MSNVCNTTLPESLDEIFGEEPKIGSGELKHISNLVAQAKMQEVYISLQEEKLAQQKEILKNLLEVIIPEAMLAVGMSDVGLADGSRVKIAPFHYGSITEKNKDEAHAWLEDNGFGGLIKREVIVSFGRYVEGADALAKYLLGMGLPSKEKKAVNSQALNAFIRDQAEKGELVPQELFGVYSGHRTKFVKP